MKKNNIVEILLYSNRALPLSRRRELADWLTTTAQEVISRQLLLTRKLFIRSLKNSPPIYLS